MSIKWRLSMILLSFVIVIFINDCNGSQPTEESNNKKILAIVLILGFLLALLIIVLFVSLSYLAYLYFMVKKAKGNQFLKLRISYRLYE